MNRFILASKSPRRKELLAMLNFPFKVDSVEIDETLDSSMSLTDAVCDLALRKAKVIASKYSNTVVIGADTIVVIGERVLGKPADKKEAKEMLTLLSGNTHNVITAVSFLLDEREHVFYSEAKVFFYPLTVEEIDQYCDSSDPYDKAGAYGIQTMGSLFVEKIDGDFYTIVGLPIAKLKRELGIFLKEK